MATTGLRESADEIEWLWAIVAKLLKTADGVVIALGMSVVTFSISDGWVANRVLDVFVRDGRLWLDMARGAKVQPGSCYSTREAVEKGATDD
jgi:hypothetical protein